MDSQWVLEWSQEALRLALVLSLPVLATALIAGIVIGLIQTVMQLNDGTFNQIPRMVIVSVVVIALIPWMASQWVGFTTNLIRSVAGAE
jgi:flagellar biosynthetic protein FliQ